MHVYAIKLGDWEDDWEHFLAAKLYNWPGGLKRSTALVLCSRDDPASMMRTNIQTKQLSH